ncbi:hypothetical protein DVR12_00100 [Chitinophaga silvatica]|uniref:Lipocalin-like domain-containing protein n=1 Tax=Chitinophaga silvatica TaxID=2282649 RepID=A0A3E1YFP9_9BACT|nr:hypothetical protein [Chitinophaga silvatica]RFS26228.1 hypothetical protein DVR12_00100 [Chitinophaga silvatica]
MQNKLIGIWENDPADRTSIEVYGNVRMEFKNNGELIYSIIENEREQKMLLRYIIDGNTLITDQPSHPEKMRSEFSIDDDILELTFDGIRSRYLRVII